MKKNAVYVVVFVLFFFVCFYILAFVVDQDHTKEHHVDLDFSWSTLQVNVTQGGIATVICTIFNTDYNYSINAGLTTYASAFNYGDLPWNSSSQPRVFNVTFNPWVLESLSPRETRTSILYIDFADDAPVGNYTFPLQGFNNALTVTVLPKHTTS
jgi:hypothetical protein